LRRSLPGPSRAPHQHSTTTLRHFNLARSGVGQTRSFGDVGSMFGGGASNRQRHCVNRHRYWRGNLHRFPLVRSLIGLLGRPTASHERRPADCRGADYARHPHGGGGGANRSEQDAL